MQQEMPKDEITALLAEAIHVATQTKPGDPQLLVDGLNEVFHRYNSAYVENGLFYVGAWVAQPDWPTNCAC